MKSTTARNPASMLLLSAAVLFSLSCVKTSAQNSSSEGESNAGRNNSENNSRQILQANNFEVFFATTRANEGTTYKPVYGGKRNLDMGAGSLDYGACQIDRPQSASALLGAKTFEQFKQAMGASDQDWLAAKTKRIDRLSLPDFLVKVKNWNGPIMVYVHGYDESFDKAVRDAAMIAYQFDARGSAAVLPVCFSWPSLNNKAEYAADEANLDWSTGAFFEFLDTLKSAKNPNSPLDIVAHSMGNRPLIQYCAQRKPDDINFRNIVLSGADVDFHMAESRKGDIEAAADRSVTVIVSDRDAPLITSQLLHRQPRLGRPVDPPTLRADKSALLNAGFWSQLTLDASALIVPNGLNLDQDVVRWINQNPSLGKEYGEKTIFIDVTDLVLGEMGHRLAYPVISGILRESLAPLSSTVVYKRPDKLTLEAAGGNPRWLYRFHKIDSQKFRQ